MMIFFLNFGPIMAIEKSQNALDFSTFNFLIYLFECEKNCTKASLGIRAVLKVLRFSILSPPLLFHN